VVVSFSERDCDAMDHARDQAKERDHETRCRLNVKAPSGVLLGVLVHRLLPRQRATPGSA
jgi:hypothetical protein